MVTERMVRQLFYLVKLGTNLAFWLTFYIFFDGATLLISPRSLFASVAGTPV